MYSHNLDTHMHTHVSSYFNTTRAILRNVHYAAQQFYYFVAFNNVIPMSLHEETWKSQVYTF